MMRKIFLILLGAVAGAGLTLLATQPLTVLVGSSAKAASSDTYRQLNLFGEADRARAAPYSSQRAVPKIFACCCRATASARLK